MERGSTEIALVTRYSSAAYRLAEHIHQFGDRLIAALLADGVGDAAADVAFEDALGDFIGRRRDRLQLGDDVQAIAPLLNHLLHAAHLPLDPAQARDD